ncbi:MAG: glycosyltransferase [Prosthecobacter sp.]|jgi:rhamnosyltransferase|uniref:glycosyltransferase family 2 protein n=1 Tax=Prosthecobacter sp. TaxID=1965333 RepID=UPI0019EBA44B|nr:glycosyltransferase [Prosthecobacter sp.]MBE2286273.1 glycosyltransferase [Prosthecobacter sp.]
MSDPLISIVMRSYNEAWALKETLPALAAQAYAPFELIVIDSGSSDGSQDLIHAASPAHFIQITPQEYNPSRVMNHGMRLAKSDRVLFLNADATPQGPNWLRPLADALLDKKTAACFSRQIPRPDCEAVFACDYDRCFGPQRESSTWDHFFSMVSSGLRKDVWAQRGFREDLQYAEDDEYTRWCKANGYHIRYVPESVAMHSHNYTPAQARKRAHGDARAFAQAGSISAKDRRWTKTVLLGLLSDARHDLRWCRRNKRLSEFLHALRIRWNQRLGKYTGFRTA